MHFSFVVVLLVFQLYCTCFAQTTNTFPDIIKYRNDSIEQYGFIAVNPNEVTYRLYTKDQNSTYVQIYTGFLDYQNVLDPNNPVKIIIHGYTDNANSTWLKNIMAAYFKKGDYNVILVDWSLPAGRIYPLAAGATKNVGMYVGQLITDMNNMLGVPYSNVHIVGHSLGAHVGGFAGKYFKLKNNITFGRISGLDPAGPLFLFTPASCKLSIGDATFVDNIHTNGNLYGNIFPTGNADFYPNGGVSIQPQCQTGTDAIIKDLRGCSHESVGGFFIESINSNDFVAKRCSNYPVYMLQLCNKNKEAIMGENCDSFSSGMYFLSTNKVPPYARGQKL